MKIEIDIEWFRAKAKQSKNRVDELNKTEKNLDGLLLMNRELGKLDMINEIIEKVKGEIGEKMLDE